MIKYTVLERFQYYIKECNEHEIVECHSMATGTVYSTIEDLPEALAKESAMHAYFRFMPERDIAF